MLERFIGPVAYRGRTNYIQKKSGNRLNAAAQGKEEESFGNRFIPRNTIRSERSNSGGPPNRRPGHV